MYLYVSEHCVFRPTGSLHTGFTNDWENMCAGQYRHVQ
jgi:hypothetical protein